MSDDEPRLVPNHEMCEQLLRNDIEIMIVVEAILAKRVMDIAVSEAAIRKQIGKTEALLESLE